MASVSLQSAKISRALMKMNLSGRKQLVSTQSWSPRKWLEKPWSLFFAIICTVLVLQLETSENLSTTAHSLAAVTLMIAILWISEALPVILTSALPLALFPLFEIASFDEVWPVYLKDLIWLFFGGFQLAFAVETFAPYHCSYRSVIWVHCSNGDCEEWVYAPFISKYFIAGFYCHLLGCWIKGCVDSDPTINPEEVLCP